MKAFIAILLFVSVASAQFPSFIKLCKRTEDLNKCIIDNIETLKNGGHLKKGVPKLHVPPLNPLIIPTVEIQSNNLLIKLMNLNVFNLDNFNIKSLDVDLDKNSFTIKLVFLNPHLSGEYKLDGKLLLLQLNGAGHFNMNLTNIEGLATISGNRIEKNGKSYLNFVDRKVTLGINQIQMYFDNLFPNNEELTKSTNQLINENSKEVLQELQPVIEETIVGIVVELISKLFMKFSIDELFVM